ncbi:MAG: hypothetical protein WC431_03020 [Candidatus Omnitrophota bacterium]|jgi:hypothetical protein
MTGNLAQNWPVYVLGAAVIFFFIFMIVKSNQGTKEEGKAQPLDKVNK